MVLAQCSMLNFLECLLHNIGLSKCLNGVNVGYDISRVARVLGHTFRIHSHVAIYWDAKVLPGGQRDGTMYMEKSSQRANMLACKTQSKLHNDQKVSFSY